MAGGALVKTVAKGAIQKKAKKKGAEMAKNIINKKEKDNSSSIVVREKSTTLSTPLLGGDTDSTDSSANTPKKSRSRSPLDRINSSLKDIMKTLKKRRKLMLNKSRRMRVQANKEKKGKREGLLEKKKKDGKKMLGNVKAAAVGWWERLQKFLLMTFLGSLVLSIKENWEAIQEKIKETVTKIKELWENLEPILTPIWQIAKWIAVEGFKLIKPLFGMGKDKAEIEKGTDEVSEGLKKIDAEKSKLTGLFEKSVKDTEKLKDEDYSKEFKDLEKMESVDEENPGDDLKETEQTVVDVKDKIEEIKLDLPKFEKGASPVPETGPAIVHKGEVIIPAPVVKRAGGVMNIENMVNMMQTSTTNIKQNPLKVISIMEGMSKQFAPMGEQLPSLINETIKESKLGTVSKKVTREMVEKMEKTLTVLKEQTEYEDQSASTVIIRVPTPSSQSVGGGGGGSRTIVVPVGESGKATLNRYINALTQKALY
jgi:hypothetical protein